MQAPKSFSPRPFRSRSLALCLIVVAVLAIGIYWQRLLDSADQLRSSAFRQQALTAARLAAAASTQTEALVRNLDSVLIHLRADYLAHPEQFTASLQAVISGLPDGAVPQIGIINADGFLATSSLGVAGKMYLGDREHFRIHVDGTYGDRLFISMPIFGRRSNKWSIQLARRIERGGKFQGVIVASVSPEYIASQLVKFDLGGNDTIAIFRQDGVYLSRTPKLLDYMGKSVPIERPFIGPGAADQGIFRATATHEPIERTFAWRRLGDLPLIAVAGLSEADFVAPLENEIRHNLVRNGAGTIFVVLLTGTIALLLLRLGRQQARLQASEARFRILFEILPEGVLLVGPDGKITGANDAACLILGTDHRRLNQRPYRLFYPDDRPVPPEDYPSRRAIREGSLSTQELFTVEKEGARHWISVSSRRMLDTPEGEPMGIAISISDVTRLVEMEESLRVSQSVFDATAEGIMVTDADNIIIGVNPAFSMITGYSAEQAIGETPRILASGLHDHAFYEAMYRTLSEYGHWEGEITNRRPDGSLYVEWLKINSVRDAEGRTTRHVALLSDVTARKRQQEEIWHQANHDPLTDLPNRILFQDRLKQATAQATRRQSRVVVLFIDLDRFKPVNDTYGHPVGDELLRQAARRISNCIRGEDTVARVGGDEFLVLLPNVAGADVGYKVAEKILAVLSEPFVLSATDVGIGASIGIALFPDHAASADDLLTLADSAMYQAKAAGRGTIRSCCAQPEEDQPHDRICGRSPSVANNS